MRPRPKARRGPMPEIKLDIKVDEESVRRFVQDLILADEREREALLDAEQRKKRGTGARERQREVAQARAELASSPHEPPATAAEALSSSPGVSNDEHEMLVPWRSLDEAGKEAVRNLLRWATRR